MLICALLIALLGLDTRAEVISSWTLNNDGADSESGACIGFRQGIQDISVTSSTGSMSVDCNAGKTTYIFSTLASMAQISHVIVVSDWKNSFDKQFWSKDSTLSLGFSAYDGTADFTKALAETRWTDLG